MELLELGDKKLDHPRDYSSTDNDPKNSLKTANSSTHRGSNEQNGILRRNSEAVRSP